MPNLVWNVFVDNFNQRRIEVYNIFDHYRFKEDCDKAWRANSNSFADFSESVKGSLTYFFWSKCEWEIILSGFPPDKKFQDKKVDVYTQVMLNWSVFIDYVWNTYKSSSKLKYIAQDINQEVVRCVSELREHFGLGDISNLCDESQALDITTKELMKF